MRDILGSSDCFICEADLYVPDDTIFLRQYSTSCYFGKMIEGYSSDWVFDVQNGNITRVGKAVQTHITWQVFLIGKGQMR